MSFFDFFRLSNRKSANAAKERLQIVVAHQKARTNHSEDFLPKLRQELIDVIGKYIPVNEEQINVSLEREGDCSVLELNVTLPDTEEAQLETEPSV